MGEVDRCRTCGSYLDFDTDGMGTVIAYCPACERRRLAGVRMSEPAPNVPQTITLSELPATIKRIRGARLQPQMDFARSIGLSVDIVSRLELGKAKRLKPAVREALLEHLGITVASDRPATKRRAPKTTQIKARVTDQFGVPIKGVRVKIRRATKAEVEAENARNGNGRDLLAELRADYIAKLKEFRGALDHEIDSMEEG